MSIVHLPEIRPRLALRPWWTHLPPHCGNGMNVLSRLVIMMARTMRTARVRARAMLLRARRRKERMTTMGAMVRIMMLTRKVVMSTTMTTTMTMKRHVGCFVGCFAFVDHCYRAAMPAARRARSQPYEAKTRKIQRNKRERMTTWGRTWKRMPVWPMLVPSLHRVAPPLGVALPPPQLPPPLRSPPPAAPVVCGRLG